MKYLRLALIPLLILTVFVVKTPQAHASPALPTCTSTYLSDWNWPKWVKDPYDAGSGDYKGGNITTFDYSNGDYIIFKAAGSGTRSVYTIYVGTGLSLDVDPTYGTRLYANNNTSLSSATIYSEPTNIAAYKTIWGSTSGLKSDGEPFDYTMVSPGSNQTTPRNFSSGQADCVVTAHGVDYGPSWTYDQFAKQQSYTATNGTVCTALDFGCWIGKAFDGVENTLSGIAKAAFQAYVNLFIPDSTNTNTRLTELKTTIGNQLGFVATGATALINIFDSFNSSTTCSSTSCTQTFGNFFGHSFSINLAQANNTMPTLFAWGCGLLRATVVLQLYFLCSRKYMEVLSK